VRKKAAEAIYNIIQSINTKYARQQSKLYVYGHFWLQSLYLVEVAVKFKGLIHVVNLFTFRS